MMEVAGLAGTFFLIVVVVIVFMLIGRGRWPSGSASNRPSEAPQDSLRRRLASGDLTPDEYEKRKVLLDRDGGRPG